MNGSHEKGSKDAGSRVGLRGIRSSEGCMVKVGQEGMAVYVDEVPDREARMDL